MGEPEPVRVSAGWALWSKYPGTNDDYSVLAASAEPFSREEFSSVLGFFAPGTPSTERGRPDSLPWVTISRVGVDEQLYLGIAIIRPTEEVDATGRPITATSYFCVSYRDVAGQPVSYLGLYQAVERVQLPLDGTGQLDLTIPRLDPKALAQDIRALGEEAALSTAALLLARQVTITAAEGSVLAERFRYLDAVASLLPYGYRAWYTASTWSDAGATNRIRLAFAGQASQDATVVRWRSAPEAGPADAEGPAPAYLRRLTQAVRRPCDTDRLVDLIGRFTQDAQPHKFDQPRYALGRLRDFDLPFAVLDEVLGAEADPAGVRQVFASARLPELPEQGRQTLLSWLISLDDQQDWPAIQHWFGIVGGEEPAVLLPALVTTCHRLVWSVPPRPAIGRYLTLATRHGLADGLLAGLMVRPESARDSAAGLTTTAELLTEWVLKPPGPEGFPATLAALANDPLVAAEWLAQLAGSGDKVSAAVAWLQPVLRAFLRAFFIVLGDEQGTVDRQQVDQLARYDMACVRALLQAADKAGRLDRVLPALAGWLVKTVVDTPAQLDAGYWRELTAPFAPAGAPAQAWLDLALLAIGRAPRFLLENPADRKGYAECLSDAWLRLAAELGSAADNLLTGALIEYLGGQQWTADPARADVVVEITTRLTEAGSRPELEAVIASALSAAEAKPWRVAAKWLGLVRGTRPDLIKEGTLFVLRRTPRDTALTQVADLCVQAFRNDVPPLEVGRALAESPVIQSGAMAAAMLSELRQGLGESDPRRAQQWVWTFTAMFANGTFGKRTAAEFRELIVASSCDEIAYRLDLLFIAATGGSVNSPPELSDAHFAQLNTIQLSTDRILSDARKRRKARGQERSAAQ